MSLMNALFIFGSYQFHQLIGARLFSLNLIICLAVTACSESNELEQNTLRWYSSAQVVKGEVVFTQHCASCHGEKAQGFQENWKEKLADGSFPPPPLNGTAHTWHHPLEVLIQVLDEGGVALGGKMPGFSDLLKPEEKLAVVAYIQNYWNDEIYQNWKRMDGSN